jgi:alpha-tubulin suppressor-like RCC1 family protein
VRRRNAVGQARSALENARRRALAIALVAASLAATLLALGALAPVAVARTASAGEEALPSGLVAAAPPLAKAGSRLLRAREAAAAAGGISLTPSSTRPYYVCPEGTCQAIVDPQPVQKTVHGKRRLALPDGTPLQGSGEKGGYDPQDLQSAYDIPTTGGAGETIAIVDAYGFQEAEQSLAVYRERYGLPPCTTANGCFRKVNQKGQESDYPVENGWNSEQALDIEMVSAACPECHILLVQADTASETALGAAENTAVKLGAIEVSNSWSSPEQECNLTKCEKYEEEYFEHPGVMLFFAGGDNAYDNYYEGADSPDYPASLPSVVAVGGTVLYRADNARGWSEEPWYEPSDRDGGGSGCSRFPKPSWQTDPGCAGRMTVDVAADGACESPMSVYAGKWELICGTSASSPLVAGIEAHAEEYVRSLPGAEAFYEAVSGLNDVTTGVNGKCSDAPEVAYFCRAEEGYDGPTGNGTPEGPLQVGTAAPTVTTRGPSAVSASQATLRGYVSPRGLATSYWFEYGTSTGYGSRIPVPEGSVGTTGQQVSETVELQPQSAYHYRLVASNVDGTSYGSDEAFSTGAPSVTGVSPGTDAASGGATVTVTGANFLGATAVDFGSRPSPQFTVQSDGSISAQAPPGTGAVQVTVTTPLATSASGDADRFVYDPPGSVLAWGENSGDLGDGELEGSEVPVEVHGLSEAQALAAGWGQSVALLQGGKLLAWGENEFGVVGDGTYDQRTTPVGVCALGVSECPDGPYLEEVTAVSAGRLPTLALLADGTVAAWGGNLYGDLATDTERNPYPLPVCTVLESPCKPENYLREVVEIAAGADFSLARLRDGTVMAWGENAQGELGDGTTTGPETCDAENQGCSRIPRPVSGLGEVAAIAAGSFDGLALLRNGTVMAWGADEFGQLGDGADKLSSVPRAVCAIGEDKSPCRSELGEVRAISGGFYNGYALLNDGTVAAWGYNGEGALGDGETTGPQACKEEKIKFACGLGPGLVQGLSGVRTLAQGEYAWGGLAELEDGQLQTWGSGNWGVIGDGTVAASDVPVGVCAPFVYGPCPSGPFLHGAFTAIASGTHDLAALPPVSGPVVSSLTPDTGPAAGGTDVTILGGYLQDASAVDFGGVAASEFQVRSDDEILAVAPPGSGAVAVTVTTPQGTSSTESEDEFTYEGAPTVVTEAASHVEADAATLNASVDPDGETVDECRFEYGTTPAYGTSVPCSSLPGSGIGYVAVSANVSGLQRGSAYYFRAVAGNLEGTGVGAQQTFTTQQFPELGRCVKAASAHARYKTSACTKLSAGGDSGKYEWQPWPLANPHFTLTLEKVPLEVAAGKTTKAFVILECASGSAQGEYTGPQTATMSLVLSGCGLRLLGTQSCSSPGAAAGEVRVADLPAQLGFIEDGPKPSVGWALNSPTSGPLATFNCETIPTSLQGSVIGAVQPVDKMGQTDALAYKGSEGAQTPESFEGGAQDTLELDSYDLAPVSLDTDGAIANAEAVEIRAVE